MLAETTRSLIGRQSSGGGRLRAGGAAPRVPDTRGRPAHPASDPADNHRHRKHSLPFRATRAGAPPPAGGRTTPSVGRTTLPPMPIEVRPVRGLVARHRFVDFPFKLFSHDPEWVPPLRLAVYDRISRRYPAQDHQQTQLWLAYRRGRPVGRIGACIDHLFNELHEEKVGWVGFFESFDDPAVARALLDTACQWVADRGVAASLGPASFTTNDECGLLVDGFEHPPLVMTPHNPPYYARLWTGSGWEPAMDLWGWWHTRETAGLSERQRAVLERIKQRADAHVRTVDINDYEADAARLLDLY